jgi:hypothetical protein
LIHSLHRVDIGGPESPDQSSAIHSADVIQADGGNNIQARAIGMHYDFVWIWPSRNPAGDCRNDRGHPKSIGHIVLNDEGRPRFPDFVT